MTKGRGALAWRTMAATHLQKRLGLLVGLLDRCAVSRLETLLDVAGAAIEAGFSESTFLI